MPALNIFDYQDRADLGYELRNASGVLVNGTVTATAVNGSGVASGLTVTTSATGIYAATVDIDVDAPGRWYGHFRATGAVIDAETVSFYVRPAQPVRSDAAYANVDDVVRLTQGRTYTASSRPTVDDVVQWLSSTKTELDGMLRRGGYEVPVDTTATSALALLAHGNALGAACLVETSAPTSDRRAMACKLWTEFKASVLAGSLELDTTKDATNSAPRSNAANQATPMFYRDPLTLGTGRDW
jgi:hypothetical protein